MTQNINAASDSTKLREFLNSIDSDYPTEYQGPEAPSSLDWSASDECIHLIHSLDGDSLATLQQLLRHSYTMGLAEGESK